MPSGVEYISHTLTAGFDSTYTITGTNGTGVWKIPNLASATIDLTNSSKILRFTERVVSPLKQTNIVEVVKNETFDPNLANNKAQASETPRRADVEIIKDVDNEFPGVNTNVTFKITIKNNGVDIASNIEVTDLLPAGLSYISNSTTTGTYNQTTGVWSDISTLNVGATETLTLVAKVSKVGRITNVAEITRVDTYDDNPANNKDDASVEAQNSDLSIVKTVTNDKPDLYSNITYTLTITNNGPSTARAVEVTDKLPTGLEFISATSTDVPASQYDLATGKWTSIGDILNQGQVKLFYTVKVIGQLNSITNQAKVSTTTADSNPNNNVDTVVVFPVYADLEIKKTISNPAPFINEEVVFTIKVTNLGKDTATDVIVDDVLPAGLEFVSATTADGVYNNTTGKWNLSNPLKKNDTSELLIRTKVISPNKLTNTSTVKSTQVDPNLTNNTSSADVDALSNEIIVKKTVNNNKPPFNSNVTYNVEVENVGEDNIPSLIIEDKLPSGVSYVSSSDVNYNQALGQWLITNLLPKSKRTLTIIAKVISIDGKITNCADAKIVPGDTDLENNKSCVDIEAEFTNLKVTKEAITPEVNIGSNGKFKIVVTNEGPDIAKNVILTDLVPNNSQFISSDNAGYSPITGVLSLGDMAKAEVRTIILEFKILNVKNVVNTVEVKTDTVETNYNDNKATSTITPIGADTSIDKSSSNPTPNLYDEFTYTIKVKNSGPSIAKNAKVNEILPIGVEYVSHTQTKGSWDKSIWTIGDMANGEEQTLTIKAIMKSLNITENKVKVSSDTFDQNLSNNEDIEKNDPIYADLQILKTVDNPTPEAGSEITYTIIFTNNGKNDAEDVVIVDELPSGYTIKSADTTLGTLSADKKTITLAKLNVGQIGEITYKVQLPANTNSVKNIVTIKSNKTPDPNLANNRSEVVVDPKAADLKIVKTVDNSKPKVGETVNYKLEITNNGPSDAPNVEVEDVLSSDLEFISSSTPLTKTGNNYKFTIAKLNVGQTVTINIVAKVISFVPTIVNEASVKSELIDLDISNNKSTVTINPKYTVLKLLKTVDNAKPQVGQEVTYTITIEVLEQEAENLQIFETLPDPSLVQFVSASTATGVYDEAGNVWKLGNVGIGKYELTLKVKELSHILNRNIVKVTTDTPQKNPETEKFVDVDPNGKPIANDDYGKTKPNTPIPLSIVEGAIVGSLTLPLLDQSVKDTDPDGDDLFITQINGSDVTIGQTVTLPDGSKVTILNSKKVVVDPVDPTRTNPVIFDYTISDGNGGTDSAKVTVDIIPLEADVTALKTVDNSKPQVGNQVVFTLTTTNKGPDIALDVVVKDILPSNFKFVSTTSPVFNPLTNTANLGTLNVGDIYVITFTAQALDEKPSVNKMEVTTKSLDKDLTNNKSEVPLDPNGKPDAIDDQGITKPFNPILMGLVEGNLSTTNALPTVDNSVADTDPDGDSLNIKAINGSTFTPGVVITLPSGDKVTVNPDLKTVVVQAKNNTSIDPIKFTHTITDGHGGEDTANVTVTLIPVEADVNLSKVVDNNKPQVGEIVEYTVAVINKGPDESKSVLVTDQLPTGLEYVSDDSLGTYDKTNGKWNVGDLKVNETKSLKIKAKVLISKTIINIATVTVTTPDPTPNPPVEVPIYPNDKPVAKDDQGITYPNLPIELKIVDGGTAVANAQGQYDNSVKDTDPDGDPLKIIEIDGKPVVDNTEVILSNGAKVKTLSDLKTVFVTAANATTTKDFSFKYKITDSRGGFAEATVNVKILVDPSPDVDTTKFNTPIKVDALQNDIATDPLIASFDGAKVVKPNPDGSLPTTEIKPEPENDKCKGLKGIELVLCKIKITFIGNIEVKSFAQAAGDKITNIVKVTNGTATLNADGSVTVTPNTGFTGVIEFTYEVKDSDGDIKETTVTITVPKPIADIDNTKSVNNPTPQVGEVIDFTLTAINRGPDTAENVYVLDKLPAGLEYVSDDSAGKYNSTSGKWTIGSLTNGASAKIIIKGKAISHEKMVNVATVYTDTQDPTPNPPKEVPVDPNGKPIAKDDLGLTKPNQPITMSIVDGGIGIQQDKTIDNSVKDTDPDNDPLKIIKLNGQDVVSGSIVNLDTMTTVKLNPDLKTITVLTTDPTRTIDIKFTYAITDGKGGFADANVTVTLLPLAADLEVKKTVLPLSNHMINDTIEYLIVVKNLGPDTAIDVEVTDILPESLAFISSEDKNYDIKTGIVKIASLANSEIYTLKIKAKILQEGTISNTATVTSKIPDPDPKNNKSTVTINPGKPTPRTGGVITYGIGIAALISLSAFILYKRTRKNRE